MYLWIIKWLKFFVLFPGKVHGLQRSTARRTNRSLPKRMPWRTHWNRFRSYRNKPSACFCSTHNRIYAGQRVWFRKGAGQGKETCFFYYAFNTIDQNKWLWKWKSLNLITPTGLITCTFYSRYAKNSNCVVKLTGITYC